MSKKIPLSEEQMADAVRLKALYKAKARQLGLTQELIADELGITQGGVSHYLNGKNALNTKVAAAFARLFKVSVRDFSPSLHNQIQNYYNRSGQDPIQDLAQEIEEFSPSEMAELKAQIDLIKRRKRGEL